LTNITEAQAAHNFSIKIEHAFVIRMLNLYAGLENLFSNSVLGS